MAANSSRRFSRKKCTAVVLALLVVQVMLLLYFSPSMISHSRPFSKHQSNSVRIAAIPTTEASFNLSTTRPPTPSPSNPTTTTVSYTLRPPAMESYPTWKNGTFCDKYIGRTFSKPLPVCRAGEERESSLTCSCSPISRNMAVCTAQFLAVQPRKLQQAVKDCDTCRIDKSGAFHLIRNNLSYCPEPSLKALESNSEKNDPVYRSMLDVTSNSAISAETCQVWVNKTAYFFSSQRYHIYFRLYSYYNLYKTLLDRKATVGEYVVVRMSEASGYKFESFERSLFPELRTLGEFPDQRVCFREVVFSPWAYAAVMFRCKMETQTKSKCLECDGKGKLGTSLLNFRTRVLQACSLKDQTPEERKNRKEKSIVFVKRKPYNRWEGDTAHSFQRVLKNQDSVVGELKSHFPEVKVHDVFMEDMDLCEQMRLVHGSDVYIGVHGAGLVHLWWLQDDAALLELAPASHSQNVSFRTLAKLTGRRYHLLSISGDKYHVAVDIPKMLDVVKGIISDKR